MWKKSKKRQKAALTAFHAAFCRTGGGSGARAQYGALYVVLEKPKVWINAELGRAKRRERNVDNFIKND